MLLVLEVVKTKALRFVIIIGYSIKIRVKMSILRLYKFDFNVIILIHSKLSKLAMFCI
jgi:hypothetical protein